MNINWLLFSFEGRISRQTYWLFIVATMVVCLLPMYFLFGDNVEGASHYLNVMSVLLIWPSLAVQAKRWHDRDKSGWWILINFIPIIGWLWALIENGFLKGTEGPNRYGYDPLQMTGTSMTKEN